MFLVWFFVILGGFAVATKALMYSDYGILLVPAFIIFVILWILLLARGFFQTQNYRKNPWES